MAFLITCIQVIKEQFGLPEKEGKYDEYKSVRNIC